MELMKDKHDIPKIIWILWLQGLDQAPLVVRECYESWKKYNKDWDIRFMDEEEMSSYVDLHPIIERNNDTITNQKIANIARLNLLAKYGGVWVDASCFCCKPLNSWFTQLTAGGFFAFYKPAQDRLLANWFIASNVHCQLTKIFNRHHNQFFMDNTFKNESRWKIINGLQYFLNRNPQTTRFWFSPFVLKLFQIHPYFIFHYLFTETLRKDSQCRQIWNKMQKISAGIPLKLHNTELLKPVPTALKLHIDNLMAPVYKLNWKVDEKRISNGTVIEYLIKVHG